MVDHVLRFTIPAAYDVLPAKMRSREATALLLAIGLQESKFLHRRQVVDGGRLGPARGFWQFESGGGLHGVLTHRSTRALSVDVLRGLRYSVAQRAVIHGWLEHNDVLACAFARMLLWTLPVRLPDRDDSAGGYGQYLAAWRPGKPHPETWAAYFVEAWQRVDQLPLGEP